MMMNDTLRRRLQNAMVQARCLRCSNTRTMIAVAQGDARLVWECPSCGSFLTSEQIVASERSVGRYIAPVPSHVSQL